MTRTVRGVLIVVVISIACSRAAVRVELHRSVGLLAAGNAQQALERLERLERLGVDAAIVDFDAGMALLQLKRLDEAAVRFRRVAERDAGPFRGEALFAAGNASALAGRYGEAIEAYRETLRMRPEDDDARFNLAWVMMRLNDSQPPPAKAADDALQSLEQLSNPLHLDITKPPATRQQVDAR